MNNRITIGHLACAGAYIIFGINVVVCRDIATDGGLEPIVLFAMRSLVAGALFWLVSLFAPKEKVPPKDLLRLAGAGVLGLFLPQLTFLHAIAHTTPVDLSVMSTTTPIFTMFVAAIFLKEPITWKKALGVAMSFGGILCKKRVPTEQFSDPRQNNQQGEQNLCPKPDIPCPKFLLLQVQRNVPYKYLQLIK